VLAYYGGNNGAGADYSGWYYEEDGTATGFGAHPPGSSFKVYDLAEALRQNVSLETKFDAPATKEFPASGRVNGTVAGPVRNASTAPCQPSCSLIDATVASLNVPFFDLTEKIGPANVLEMAAKAGIDDMWANVDGQNAPARTDLRGKPGKELIGKFSTELGIGQYGVTVLDHANGMATMAAGGQRAQAHFVRSVQRGDDTVYNEPSTRTPIGLNADQMTWLDYTLHWDAAGKTGTWQAGDSLTKNAHTWMVGYTHALAAAVWVGTTDGTALVTSSGSTEVFGANYPGPIWRQFMKDATNAMQLDKKLSKFGTPKRTPSPTPSSSPTPSPTPKPTSTPAPAPTTRTILPTLTPPPAPTPTGPAPSPELTTLSPPPAVLRTTDPP
jgi:membrane peptidoglycan carboxypeptidase